MEWVISALIVIPAMLLCARNSHLLVDYAIWVVAFNRLIRRLVDYYCNGGFNPFSPISLTPLLVACMLCVSAVSKKEVLSKRGKTIFALFAAALIHGLVVGLVRNRFAAVYGFSEWMAGLSVMLFCAVVPVRSNVADRWVKSWVWAGVLVAVYGWYQYFTIPAWDAMWVEAVGFVGYLGQLEPTKMVVFSSLPERGPCSGFLIWAAVPALLSQRWRVVGSFLVPIVILSVVPLTAVRTGFIEFALIGLLHPLLHRGRSLISVLLVATLLGVAAKYGMEKLPGNEKITERYQTLQRITDDGSFQARIGITKQGLGAVLRNPLGLGLGSSGLGNRVNTGELGGGEIGDSGYIQILAQFGWLGTLCFFGALGLLWKESTRLYGFKVADDFTLATRTFLPVLLVVLYVADNFAGFSLFWIFFGRALMRSRAFELHLKRRKRQVHNEGEPGRVLPSIA